MSMNDKTSIHQGHGHHHAPFFRDEEFIYHLNDIIQTSKPENSIETDVYLDDTDGKFTTNVIGLLYESGKVGYISLLALNKAKDHYEFISCYPYLNGSVHDVEIEEVFEWSNCIEATVKCVYRNADDDEDFEFYFFATDYYLNKSRYQVGAKIRLNIAASALHAQQGSLGFELTGQSAIDFLANGGEEPTYNANGEVEPVKFSTAETVAFIPSDDCVPDMGEFMSPIKVIDTDMPFFDSEISCGEIMIHRDPDFKVLLYYSAETNIAPGYPIMGHLWLSGRIASE